MKNHRNNLILFTFNDLFKLSFFLLSSFLRVSSRACFYSKEETSVCDQKYNSISISFTYLLETCAHCTMLLGQIKIRIKNYKLACLEFLLLRTSIVLVTVRSLFAQMAAHFQGFDEIGSVIFARAAKNNGTE